ncbi:MAG: hypothetical protein WAU84_25055, partial [Thermoguttaceae bacterium]
PILKQCLGNGRADTGQGGKDGAQAGVDVQFTARSCVPMAPDGSRVIKGRPRSKTPPESLRGTLSGDHVALDGSPGASEGVRARQDIAHGPIPAPNRIWRSAVGRNQEADPSAAENWTSPPRRFRC